MARPRWLEKFASIDGLTSYPFPRYGHETSHRQGLRTAYAPVIGADYAVDLLGTLPASKEPGEESVKFLLAGETAAAVDTEWDLARGTIQRIGRGKLWSIDDTGSRRWCWARPQEMVEGDLARENFTFMPVSVTFDRLSDWFAETATTIIEPVTTTPHSFTITVTGNTPVRNAVFRFRSNGATSANLITNGTFEQDSAGWSAYNGATKTKEVFDAHSGSGSMQIVTPGAVAGEGAISDFCPAVAGATYRYQLWAKQNGTGGHVKAEAWAHDDSGFLANLQGSAAVTLDGTWQLITGEVTTPAGTTRLTITIYTDGLTEALTFWVDDVSLRRVGGFSAPQVTNLTTGESFGSTRVAAGANDELRVDCGRYAVEYSTTNGLSYSGDYANFTTGSTQVAFMTLIQGTNTFQLSDGGVPDYSLEITFSDTFH